MSFRCCTDHLFLPKLIDVVCKKHEGGQGLNPENKMPARNSCRAGQFRHFRAPSKLSYSPSPLSLTIIICSIWLLQLCYSLTHSFLYCNNRAQRIKCPISCHFSAQSAWNNVRDFPCAADCRMLWLNSSGFLLAKHWQSSVQVQLDGELTGDSLHAWCDGVQESFGGSGV